MNKIFIKLLLAAAFASLLSTVSLAKSFYANEDGKFTVEIETDTPNTDFAIIVVAGDYTDGEMPNPSEENIIYIDQICSDENGKVSFEDFIPLTDSVGTIYISGKERASSVGLLLNESGLGFIAGTLVSYSGDNESIVIPEGFTTLGDGFLKNGGKVKRVFIPSSVKNISESSIAKGIKIFASPRIADEIKTFAIENSYSFSVLGDYNGDSTVDMEDMHEIVSHFASGADKDEDFVYYFDLNFDGSVNLIDASVLLKYLGGKIYDFLS